jgi:KDO2-lipid IV(A) lauroyltransferase
VSRLLFGCLSALLARVPLCAGYAIANALAPGHLWFFPKRRHAVLVNLATILPGRSRRERMRTVRRMMASYNCMLFEFFRMPHLTRDELLNCVDVVGHDHVIAALARGKGLIVASSHIGNWELGAVALAYLGHPVHAVAGDQLGRWLGPGVRDAKSELAVFTIKPQDGFRKLWRALASNDLLALMVDGDIFGQGIVLPFFGSEVRWPAGPGQLSKRTGAPVTSAFCERLGGGRFRLVLEPLLDPDHYESADALNMAIAQATQRHVREHLDQWCIFRPFWTDTSEVQNDAAAASHEIVA